MKDFLFRGSLADLDPDLHKLTQLEAERQFRRLILIPSESTAPIAVREALSSAFQNIYAEGYPDEDTRWMEDAEILDYETRLAHYRRFGDPRYYKGVEYADTAEALARRRCAQAFAANGFTADDIYVNVQALSGAPANNAVYHALVNPGDTVMGMDLLHGGHLSHGSPVNRSGKYFNIIHYTVEAGTEKIDYDKVAALAIEHKPKMIIGGFSSYPWQADWARLRAIADSVGAYFLADIAHVAGLIVGGAYPSPIGHAHIVTSTTHKTLNGPRGAIIMTTSRLLARKIDRAVFPGEQGGPHVNTFVALAMAFKIAQSEEFSQLQHQVVENCIALTQQLEERGFRIPFGGTNTHLMNLDCKSVVGEDGAALSGDMAARILDIAGIVVNRNTIPGDRSARNPSGIRMGAPWITQRGFGVAETVQLADIIADLLKACKPYYPQRGSKANLSAKVDFAILEEAKLRIRDLALSAGIDFEPTAHGYPHFYYQDDKPASDAKRVAFDLGGEQIRQFLNFALSSDAGDLDPGQSQPTRIHTPEEAIEGTLTCISSTEFRLSLPADKAGLAAAWLRALSDGYAQFEDGLLRQLPGPVWVRESAEDADPIVKGDPVSVAKPYYIGIPKGSGETLPNFAWKEEENGDLRTTALNQTHREMDAKMVPFGGWDMPVWYTSVIEEHLAVRNAAGLFDASHMGVYQVEGPDAAAFLDSVCGNDIGRLGIRNGIGDALYTHFLDPNANVIDDLYVYRRDTDKYFVVVNASNDDKDWAWLNAVKNGEVKVDEERPWARALGRDFTLRNLRDPAQGEDMRVDIPLQGPRSRRILLRLDMDAETRKRILKLQRTQVTEGIIAGIEAVISRTGYTGENMAFEIFVHPEKTVALWKALLEVGEPLGLKPVGLGARDSLRTEAGLPLYGHEMGGDLNLGVGAAGFGGFVKAHKPWFVGRSAYLAQEAARKTKLVRFRFNEKNVRLAHLGDPVLNKRGRAIGTVTSCAVDSDGFLTGMASVDRKKAKKGDPIFIFQSAPDKPGKAPSKLQSGDRATIPTAATVLRRFPK